MVLTLEEQEITQFYEEGMTVEQISEATGYTKYHIKKLLRFEPVSWPIAYIFRHLKDW
jgi:hypothetical protein